MAKKKKEIKITNKNLFIGIAIMLILAAGIFCFTLFGNSGIIQGKVIATVNGEEIRQEEIEQMQQSSASQGQQLSEEEATEQMINQVILSQKAEAQGYSISTEEVEQMIESQATQRGQSLKEVKQEIESQGFSYEEVIEGQKENIILQNYLQDKIDEQISSIPEEQLREFYDQNKEIFTQGNQGQEAPEFEGIKEQLEIFLQQEEQQQIINTLIHELRANANIQYEIDEFDGDQPQQGETEIDPEDIETIQ